MNVPEELRYTKEHEWAKNRGDGTVLVGITDYAQDSLGDITYLELPAVGTEVRSGLACGVVESVKTFSDLYSPLGGEIIEVNDALDGNEAVINGSPYGEGWFFAVKMADPSEWDTLMDAAAYEAFVASEE